MIENNNDLTFAHAADRNSRPAEANDNTNSKEDGIAAEPAQSTSTESESF